MTTSEARGWPLPYCPLLPSGIVPRGVVKKNEPSTASPRRPHPPAALCSPLPAPPAFSAGRPFSERKKRHFIKGGEAKPGSHSSAGGAVDCSDEKRKLAPPSNQRRSSPDGTVSRWPIAAQGSQGSLGVKELINTPEPSFLSLRINNRKESLPATQGQVPSK